MAALEYGSFRKAGAALGVQEASVSRRIRDLEYNLGSALFDRHSGGVLPTIAGQRLLPQARKVLRYVSEGAEIVDAVGRVKDGHLRIGIFSSLSSGFLHELSKSFHEQHEGVQLQVLDGNPAEHVAAIRQSRASVAMSVYDRSPELRLRPQLTNENDGIFVGILHFHIDVNSCKS